MMKELSLMKFLRLAAICAALAFTASDLPGVDAAPPQTPTLIDRASAMESAAKVDAARYPDADTVLVADFESIKYNKDGSARKWDEAYEKILTEKGKRGLMTISVGFTLPFTKVAIPLAEIIKPDGKVVKIDVASGSREMTDRSQMGANIYNPNDKVLQLAVPDLEIGDTLHYVIFRDDVKPRMEGAWCDYFVVEYQNPIVSYKIEIEEADGLPLAVKELKDEVRGTASYSARRNGSITTHSWTFKDVPRVFEEPSMPPLYTVVQRLLVSTIPEWSDISKWYWPISLPHLEKTTEGMKAKVRELVKGAGPDRQRRIEAIFKFVSQKIRYMGITTEDVSPGYEPHDVNITFDNKYGVCRDKAALLVAMLRLAGFEAYPVLINVGPKKDAEAPMPYFNHAIACVKEPDGSYQLMDPTDENTADLLPSYLCDKSYLVAKPDGETLMTSPIVPAEKNLLQISTEGGVEPDGSLKASSRFEFCGINDNAYRGYLSKVRPEERRLFFEGRLRQAVKGASISSMQISPDDLSDTSKPLRIDLSYTVKDFLARGKSESMIPMPWLGACFGMVNFIIGETGLEKRCFPLYNEVACGVSEEIAISLGGKVGEALAVPNCGSTDTGKASWMESAEVKGGRLDAKSSFLIKAVEFSPAEYLKLKEVLKLVEADRRKCPVFANGAPLVPQTSSANLAAEAPPPPDSELIEDSLDITIHDKGSWTAKRSSKRKILTYAGKKRCSEIKVDYNPVWESVSVNASVKGADGTVKMLGEKELNTMDAGWAGSAPRYPAAKTLVASLPGVDVGSVVESVVIYKTKGHPFLSLAESFPGMEPVGSKTISVSGSKESLASLKLNIPPDEKSDGRLIWAAKDMPALRQEDSTPPGWVYLRTLMLSTGDLDSFAKDAYDAMSKAAEGQPKAAAMSAGLCKGASSQHEKVGRIRDFVAKSIRRGGPDFGELPWSCISPADKTLADGYGNDTDCAVLLHSMLSAAELKPSFMIASPYSDVKEVVSPICSIPQGFAFKFPLVKVSLDDGMEIFLNDTDQYAKEGSTEHSGSPALGLPDAKVADVKASSPDLEDRFEETWNITVKADGSATVSKQELYYGSEFASFHKEYAEMTPENRRRHFQEMVASVAQSATPAGGLETDFSSYPGRLSFKVDIPDFAVRDGRFLQFQLPGGGVSDIFRLRSETREFPYYKASESRFTIKYDITLPEGFVNLSIYPEPFAWESNSGMGTVKLTSMHKADGLSIVCDVALKPSVTMPEYYGGLKPLHSLLSRPATNSILATKAKD